MGINGFTNSVGVHLFFSHCIDSHRESSVEAMVTVVLIRNTINFAIRYECVIQRPILPGELLASPAALHRGSPGWDYRTHSSSQHSLD